MATASTSQEDMMGTLIQTIRQEVQKPLPQTSQNSWSSRSVVPAVAPFVLIVLDQKDKV